MLVMFIIVHDRSLSFRALCWDKAHDIADCGRWFSPGDPGLSHPPWGKGSLIEADCIRLLAVRPVRATRQSFWEGYMFDRATARPLAGCQGADDLMNLAGIPR